MQYESEPNTHSRRRGKHRGTNEVCMDVRRTTGETECEDRGKKNTEEKWNQSVPKQTQNNSIGGGDSQVHDTVKST